jgi:fructose-bisphosphate aldolase class II
VAADNAVFAFNVITVEHAEGIAAGAELAGVGVVLQVSENTVRFHGGRMTPLLAACAEVAAGARTRIGIHLDHFRDAELIDEAIATASDFGVSSIMVDAAHLAYRDNVATTARLAQRARAAGLWVEAELGEIGGKADAHAVGVRTDPHEAAEFAVETGVDGLAVAVGSAHAMATRDAELDLDLTARIADVVPIPLVLHGSSGVSDEQIHAAVHAGIRKVNIGTALNVAFTTAIRRALADHPGAVDPRGALSSGRDAVADTVTGLCRALDRALR